RELQRTIRATVQDVRRLVHDLRPPALDELGLVAAIQELAATFQRHLLITVQAPPSLPPLPAAVEVAAYRIAQEALTNVVRHAQATHCAVTLSLGPDEQAPTALCLDIVDDGIGLPDGHSTGVGLLSMRERAEELGGACAIERRAEGGTAVHARLPLT
ncbi:MAG: sensor histidine kinase, partial [Anaerolineae bacterium]|nr:sensor histidine kinase [Anaerolineae bacterium]